MMLFLIFLMITIIFLIKKTHTKILINEIFWLVVFWAFIIGVYLFSGVTWKYSMTYLSCLYIILCFGCLMLGRKYGVNTSVKLFVRETKIKRLQLYTVAGVLGVMLFCVDYIRLNGLISTQKSSYSISLMGTIGSLFVPILLVQGLYSFANELRKTGKINFKALLLLGAYTIPCILNSGRESLLYVVIGIISIFGYNAYFKEVKSWRYINLKKLFRNIFIAIVVIIVFGAIIKISSERYGVNEINTYLNTHNISPDTIQEGERWGDFKFLYYNFISYFGHQIPFLEFMLREYHGPYMFGMYELNIVSRRLPDFLGLDYNLVYNQLRQLFFSTGESFSGSWQTVLGSFIIDFGRIGTPIMCFFIGVCLGKVRKKFELTYDLRYAVLIALFCLSMFSTIQLGPFYNTLVYGSYVWWMIMFRKEEGTSKDRKTSYKKSSLK